MLTPQATLAELGFKVFPCIPNGKRPLTPHGCLDATTDEAQIEAWTEAHHGCNWGLATDGLLVVDIDPLAEGTQNPWLADQPERAADLYAAPLAITPRKASTIFSGSRLDIRSVTRPARLRRTLTLEPTEVTSSLRVADWRAGI